MALPKGKSNSGIKNLKKFQFPKGKSGYHFKRRTVICHRCQREFTSTVDHAKFCSVLCKERSRPDRQPKGRRKNPAIKCKFCESEFYPVSKNQQGKFCSRLCNGMYKIATGELNYVNKAFIYYENKCNRCGIDDDKVLCVHHIDHNRKNNDIKNLEIVCANCHHMHHYDRSQNRRKKINLLRQFLEKNPNLRVQDAPFIRKKSEK